MGSKSDFRVLIVGGGTCGLTLAHGLKKEGIAYTIFERDTADSYWNKTRDWGMLLHWGRDYLYKNLPEDLRKRLRETLVDSRYEDNEPIPHINAVTGQVLGKISMPDMSRVSRQKLRTFMTFNQDMNIAFQKRLVAITAMGPIVTAKFDDGSEEQGNLIIGSDGSRSKVREFLVGVEAAKPLNIDMTIINHAASGYTAEQARTLRQYHPIAKLGYDPDIHGIFLLTALDIPDLDKPEDWKFQTQHAWWGPPTADDLQDPKIRLKFYKERCSKLCEPFSTAALGLSDDEVIPVDRQGQWTPLPWDNHNGTVTLAGDAAHSMLPSQGLNNAVKDAGEIAEAVKLVVSGKSSLKEAITAYEDEMRPRGARDVALSLETAEKTLTSTLADSPMFKIGLEKFEGQSRAAGTVELL